jgi:ABC-type spermidine/putrescine transport system permease subunit II
VNPEINAVSTLLIAVVAAGVLGSGLIQRRRGA